MKQLATLFTTLLFAALATAQIQVNPVGSLLEASLLNPQHASENSATKLVTLNQNLGLTAEQFVTGHKHSLCDTPNSDLVKIDVQQSKNGRTHYKYQQTWKGIPIEQQYLQLHEDKGSLQSINGTLVAGLTINSSPTLTQKQALAKIVNPNIKYAWQSNDMELELQKVTSNPAASYFPKGELVIIPSKQTASKQYNLAWKFKVYSIEPHDHQQVYVNAHTGAILQKNSLLKHTYVQGDGPTNYNGNQNVTCKHHQHHYELHSPTIETRKFTGSYNGFGQAVTSLSTTFTNNEAAMDVHWGTEQTVDFLNNTLGRNGYDGTGGKLRALVGYPFQNAFWNGYFLGYGTGDTTNTSSPTSLDIVGHEYTHAMLDQIVGFQYGGESGAIEEAYSDIFGELVEHYVNGTADWKVGAEITQTNGIPNQQGLRNLADPNSHNAPSVYKGTHWHYGPTDNWGVHTNSMVYSHWFHLVAFGNGSSVNGIGIAAATELIYETLFYLQPYSDYIDLRDNSVATANSLSVFTPAMVADVEAAWNEVGLGMTGVTITNIVPAQGTKLYGGNPTLISWDTGLSISTVDIQYSVNGGISWQDIAVNHSYASGQLGWLVPQVFSNTALIQVLESGNPAVRGVSSGYFRMHSTNNQAPVALFDQITTLENFPTSIKPWQNDNDDNAVDPSSLITISGPTHGTMIQNNGTITYTPNPNFIGKDTIQYHICDFGNPILCDTSSILINVVIAPETDWAMDDWGVLNLNTTLSGNLMDNDYLLTTSWSFVGWDTVALTHGAITVYSSTGDYLYTPSSLGRDTIKYYVSNGAVSDTAYLNVFVVEDRPLANDSMNLVILYESTNGPNWTQTWNLSAPFSTWTGVMLNGSGVVCLDLDHQPNCDLTGYGGIGLQGNLPDISLPNLEKLILTRNFLNGQIPDFSGFPNLEVIAIDQNDFHGQMPDFSYLSNLKEIHFRGNQLFSYIPDFSNLPSLESLDLRNCWLAGGIPNFSNLTNLKDLNLGSNQIIGTIPDFTNLSNLTSLDVNSNNLSGTIPDFSNLTFLENLNLLFNNLQGSVPDFLNLPNITYLHLSFNQLSGVIPNFSNLQKLEVFSIADNLLTGSVPSFSNLHNVRSIQLSSNQLTGAIPDFSNDSLRILELHSNQLTGSIPNFSNTAIINLNLRDNELSDTIPNFIDLNLEQLELSNNKLTGTIPDLSSQTSLFNLILSNNFLSGSVPDFTVYNSLSNTLISGNYLTFNGIAQNLPSFGLRYAPQRDIPINQIYPGYLQVNPGGDTTQNTYFWEYIDDGTFDVIQGTNFYQPQHEGYYRCYIENTLITDPTSNWRNLILSSDTVYFFPKCNVQSTLDSLAIVCLFDTIAARHPSMLSYTWSLNGAIVGNTQKIEVIESGNYILQMQDNCQSSIVTDSILVTIDSTCIWPGDTNLDGIVNHHDLHNIGLHFGATGPARNTSTNSFKPISGPDWSQYTNVGLDLKHVDANGDGIISASDTTIILQHYSNQWATYSPPTVQAVSPIQLVPEIITVPQGVSGEFAVAYSLENGVDSLLNLYALSFDTRIMAPINVSNQVTLDSTQIPGINEYLTISRLADTNLIHNAFTKTDLIDEVIQQPSINLFTGTIGTENDLPTGDTVSIIQVVVENVQLRTINASFGTGQMTVPIQGAAAAVYFTEDFAFSTTAIPAQCGANGAVHVNLLKGTAPYTFLWSDGNTGSSNTGLAVGAYQVSITDAIGNSIVGQATVTGTDGIVVTPAVTNPTSGQSDGSIALNLSGGSGMASVVWNTGDTGQTINNLPVGQYTALVTDEQACVESFFFDLILNNTKNHSPTVSSLQIYPNPVSDVLTIKVESVLNFPEAVVIISDILGRKVLSQNTALNHGLNAIELEMSSLSEGTYFIRLETGGQSNFIGKVLKTSQGK